MNVRSVRSINHAQQVVLQRLRGRRARLKHQADQASKVESPRPVANLMPAVQMKGVSKFPPGAVPGNAPSTKVFHQQVGCSQRLALNCLFAEHGMCVRVCGICGGCVPLRVCALSRHMALHAAPVLDLYRY